MSVRVQFEHQHQSTVDKMYTEIRIIGNQPVTNRTEDIIKFITLFNQTILYQQTCLGVHTTTGFMTVQAIEPDYEKDQCTYHDRVKQHEPNTVALHQRRIHDNATITHFISVYSEEFQLLEVIKQLTGKVHYSYHRRDSSLQHLCSTLTCRTSSFVRFHIMHTEYSVCQCRTLPGKNRSFRVFSDERKERCPFGGNDNAVIGIIIITYRRNDRIGSLCLYVHYFHLIFRMKLLEIKPDTLQFSNPSKP